MAGKKVFCSTGESIAIGRDPTKSQFAVATDKRMSGLHFVVECGTQGSRVTDRKSSNGTFLNGKSIKEARLTDGDEIRSGETVFRVHLIADKQLPVAPPNPALIAAPPAIRPAPMATPEPVEILPRMGVPPPPPIAGSLGISQTAPTPPPPAAKPPAQGMGSPPRARSQAAAFSVGSWILNSQPEGWEIQEGYGLQRNVKPDAFPSSLVVMEELLGPRISFANYVESQINMFRQYLCELRIEPTTSPEIDGAEEKIAYDVRHKTKDNVEVFYRRIYARRGFTVGVLTLTTLEKDSAEVLESLHSFWAGLTFRPARGAGQPTPGH